MKMGRQVVQLSPLISLNLGPTGSFHSLWGSYSFLEMPSQTLLVKTHFLVDKINHNICIALLQGSAGLSI